MGRKKDGATALLAVAIIGGFMELLGAALVICITANCCVGNVPGGILLLCLAMSSTDQID